VNHPQINRHTAHARHRPWLQIRLTGLPSSSPPKEASHARLLLTVPEAAETLAISRSKLYELLAAAFEIASRHAPRSYPLVRGALGLRIKRWPVDGFGC